RRRCRCRVGGRRGLLGRLIVGADFLPEVADALAERRAHLRQVLRPLPDQHDHEDDHEDDQNVRAHAWMVLARQARGRSATGITSRIEVWVSEDDTTLLSKRPASLAAAMTSRSRIVDALPFCDTTQIAPFGRIRPRNSRSSASSEIAAAHDKQTVVS